MQRIIPPKLQKYIELKEGEMGWKIAEKTPDDVRKRLHRMFYEIDNQFKAEEL